MTGRTTRIGAGLALLLATTAALGLSGAPRAAAPAGPCVAPRIGFLGPLTGEAAFIGKEQVGFARYAARSLGGGVLRLVEADTQLDPSQAATAADALHADRNVLAVVGPAGSQEVLAVAPVFARAPAMPFVSGSAIAPALTNGSIRTFRRVVPSQRVQSTTIARFIRRTLEARRVAVVDDRSSYGRPLAARVQAQLRAAGVTVTRLSATPGQVDYSALVARVPAAAQVVFLPWGSAADAQLFGEQLREHGLRAIVVGSDGLDSADFTLAGSYVASFAPDVRAVEGNDAFVRGYGSRFVSNFGPPLYVATQVAIAAIRRACADGRATRAEVDGNLRRTSIPRTVLGWGIAFTPEGETRAARFSVFELGPGGRKTLVG